MYGTDVQNHAVVSGWLCTSTSSTNSRYAFSDVPWPVPPGQRAAYPLPKKRSKSAANHLLWKGVWREK